MWESYKPKWLASRLQHLGYRGKMVSKEGWLQGRRRSCLRWTARLWRCHAHCCFLLEGGMDSPSLAWTCPTMLLAPARPWVREGICQSPAPAARDSTWRGERCRREKLRQPLILLGLPLYFKLMILFYTFTKALGQRFDIFSSHGPRFIFLQKSLVPLKRSSFLSNSLIYFFSCVLMNTL